jgi:hypothetical protein
MLTEVLRKTIEQNMAIEVVVNAQTKMINR